MIISGRKVCIINDFLRRHVSVAGLVSIAAVTVLQMLPGLADQFGWFVISRAGEMI